MLEAVRSGRSAGDWDEPLRAHVAGCAGCRDVVLVAQFLHEERECAATEARLPDAGLVWWKAQLLARRAAVERAIRPIALAEKLAGAGSLALVVAGIVLNWSYVLGRLGGLTDLFQNLWGFEISLLAAIGSGLLLLLAFFLYAVCAEE